MIRLASTRDALIHVPLMETYADRTRSAGRSFIASYASARMVTLETPKVLALKVSAGLAVEVVPPFMHFFLVGCRANSDCAPIQTCVNRECVDPCSYTQCGLNALCRADSNHRARCYCPDNFKGDAYIRCERPECMSNDECPFNLACRNERCEDPCNCGLHAVCTVNDHRPQCACPPGYVGNPLVTCNIGGSKLKQE